MPGINEAPTKGNWPRYGMIKRRPYPILEATLKITICLTATLLLVAGMQSPQAAQAKAKPASTAKKTPAETWKPTAFDMDAKLLPANYAGIDLAKFDALFAAKAGSIKKGEFETTEEFETRTADKDALLNPISTHDVYAFKMSSIEVVYDADLQAYKIGKDTKQTCLANYTFGEHKDWVICTAGESGRVRDTYVGTNSYGASAKINRTFGRDVALAFPSNSPALTSAFKRNTYSAERYWYEDTLPVPLEKARGMKDMTVGVLFVGNITDAKVIEGRPTVIEPKISSPMDILILKIGVPFSLKRVIYYVVQTGEILGKKEF